MSGKQMSGKHPVASYRLQLHAGFTFARVREIAGYLRKLGVSDIYASPILAARPGSGHGYDVIDPSRVNPELGGEAGFAALMAEVKKQGLGWIQDIVPNHMAFACDNPLLMDVLENGPYSRYRDLFDIDWDHPDETISGKVLAPFLGRFYGQCLEDGEIVLRYGGGSFSVAYYEHCLPLNMDGCLEILSDGAGSLKRVLGEEHPDYVKYLGVLYVLKTLSTDPGSGERYGQIAFVKRVLGELYEGNTEVRAFVDAGVAAYNGEAGKPETFDRLDRLLAKQFFRLSFWKVAAEEINYRRFFNINELISVRVQDDENFRLTHEKTLALLREYGFRGLRVDHVDGLYDPGGYLRRLGREAGGARIWVEKILESGEPLPEHWPVSGTTGYEFMNAVTGVLCDKKNGPAMRRAYREFTGLEQDYQTLVSDKKRLIIGKEMAGDVNNLAMTIKRAFGHFRHGRDITLYGLRRAIVEILANFPVYRTYFDEDHARPEDAAFVIRAVDKAEERLPAMANEFEFLKSLFLAGPDDFRDQREYALKLDTVMRFQQYSGPLMAKGFEDTLLYVYNRLLALNEVGGSPDEFGVSPSRFHAAMRERAVKWPLAMSATATHDTKRGEDARARLAVLSEMPRQWRASIREWRRMNRGAKRRVAGRLAPDANDEYFLYQTLLAAWSFDETDVKALTERLEPLMVKSLREAKAHTSWTRPDEDYEAAALAFMHGALANADFMASFTAFRDMLAAHGVVNSLSQTLIKLVAPGVPDFYQGCELWDFSLVDPDNRRPVDFDKRRGLLHELGAKKPSPALCRELLGHYTDGRVKLYLIMRGLAARRRDASLFARGGYVQIKVAGGRRDNVLAFARRLDRRWAVAVVPRFTSKFTAPGEFPLGADVWGDTRLELPGNAPKQWADAISGRTLSADDGLALGDILESFPACLLLGG